MTINMNINIKQITREIQTDFPEADKDTIKKVLTSLICRQYLKLNKEKGKDY